MNEEERKAILDLIRDTPSAREIDQDLAMARVIRDLTRHQLVAAAGDAMVGAFEQAIMHIIKGEIAREWVEHMRRYVREDDTEE